MVALYTARIFEFFVKRLCSGLWSGCFSVLFYVFLAFYGAAVLRRVFSCILFFQFTKECDSSRSFRTRSTKSSLSRATAALGKLTVLVFKKPENILQNVAWLLSRAIFRSLGSLITLPKSDWQNLTPYYY